MGVEAFIGSWREEIKIGYDEMATALGKLNMIDNYHYFFLIY
jgi:hypothetical protein